MVSKNFYDHLDETISKNILLINGKIKIISSMDPEEAWNKIHREAQVYEDVNIDLLREKLSSGKPSFDLCMKDYGESSNVLGTVHASKGRESESFLLHFQKRRASKKLDIRRRN